MKKFSDFLDKYVTDNDDYTHLIGHKKYSIPVDEYPNFLKAGQDITQKSRVLERYPEQGPIILDIDRQSNIQYYVREMHKVINKYLSIKFNNLIVYVIETKKLIRLMYPFVCVKAGLHDIIIQDLKENITDPTQVLTSIDIYNKNILMYGSVNAGVIIHIYQILNKKLCDMMIPGDQFDENFIKDTMKILGIRKFREKDCTYWMPKIDPTDLDKRRNSLLMVKNVTTLSDFLLQFQVAKKEIFTHTSISGGSWNIPNDLLHEFYLLYANAVTLEELCLTEKHMPDYGPIVIDLDFKFEKIISPRPINKIIAKNIVIYLTNILKEILGNDHDYTCYVLQRPTRYRKHDKICDGLHIQFPYIVCEYQVHYALRNKFIKEYTTTVKHVNGMEDVYDDAVIQRNNWCLYLSTKPGMKPYDIIAIYNSKGNSDNLVNTLHLIKLLAIRNKTPEQLIKPINHDMINDYIDTKTKKINNEIKKAPEIRADQEYDEQFIRILLSMLHQSRIDDYERWIEIGMILHHCSLTLSRTGRLDWASASSPSLTDQKKKIDYYALWDEWSQKSSKYSSKVCEQQWKQLGKIKKEPLTLGSLVYFARSDNPEKYTKYQIGQYIMKQQECFPDNKLAITKIINKGHMCIAELNDNHCPFIKGTHNKKTMYMEINKLGLCLKCKACPYDMLPINGHVALPNNTLQSIFGIENVYNNVTINNNYDAKSILETFAIHKSEYEVFEDKTLNELVYLSLNGTGFKIAELVFYLYQGQFNCTANNTWYEYKDHRWRLGAPVLFKLISSDVTKYYVKLIDFYKDLKTSDAKEREHNERMIAVITGVIKSLETTTFKNSIMQDICSTFYLNNKEFENELDSRHYLIGFENGVYDLEKHEFRAGRPEDNITMSVGYDYTNEYSAYKDNLFKFLEDIIPDPDDRDFLLKYTATGLCGANKEEICLIMSGDTRNGKTKFKELVDHTLGQYFVTFSSNLLTSQRPAPNCPVPELMAFINKRFGMGSEPDAKAKINASFYKFFTGNETMPARGLYDKALIQIKPTHKIAILCNSIPLFDVNDQAVWTRTRCIEFPTKFVDNPQHSNEKKIDKTIGEQLVLWRQDFMILLIDKYKEYQRSGLVATEKILKFTKLYNAENDIYKQYLEERTEKAETHIHTSVLYNDFKKWFSSNNPTSRIPSNKIFVTGLRNNIIIEKVRVDGKSTIGTKNRKICYEQPDDLDIVIV